MQYIQSKIEILSQTEIEQIHQATLEVLATVGCRMPHARVQRLLEERGAQADYISGVIRFPSELIEISVGQVLRESHDPKIKPFRRNPFSIHPGNQANIIDYPAKSRRSGTTEDVIKGIVVCNELPFVSSIMPLVTPADIDAAIGDLYGYYLCSLYAKKPYFMFICSPESARQTLRMWEIVKQEPARAEFPPEVGYLLEPNGALSFDHYSLEMALIFADAGQKVWVAPMAMAGMDAPMTIAGTLVMQNAYNLAGIALAWALGIKGYWAGTAHTIDMRSSLCSFGSPNQVLIAISAIQLGNFYGFDVDVNSALTDACLPDFQGGFEKGMTAIVALLAGASRIGAQGIVGADQGTSLEQLVIDNEWTSAIDHIFSHGVEVSNDTLGVDVIQKVGIGGSFIAEEHSVRHMRETYWKAGIFNQTSWEAWKARGSKDAYDLAHEKVESILALHYPPQPVIGENPIAALDEVIAEAKVHPERFIL